MHIKNIEDVEQGTTLFVVRPNTSQDPVRCDAKSMVFLPLMMLTYEVAHGSYYSDEDAEKCIDVVGNCGSLNAGLSEGTRQEFGIDIGFAPEKDWVHLECQGITRAFDDLESAEAYVKDLLSEEKIAKTMAVVLEAWGMPYDDDSVSRFIEFNKGLAKLAREGSALLDEKVIGHYEAHGEKGYVPV